MAIRKHKTPKNGLKSESPIGMVSVMQSRKSAVKALSVAKQLETDRLKKGFKWLTNGSSNIFSAPQNIQKHLFNGYYPITSNTQ